MVTRHRNKVFFKQTVRFRAFNRRTIRYRGTRSKKPRSSIKHGIRVVVFRDAISFFPFLLFLFLSFFRTDGLARVVN